MPSDPKKRPKNNSSEEIKNTLKESLDQAEWAWLARHAERDAVILVAQELDLLEVALQIAEDNTATVSTWLNAGKLSKPSRAQLDAWNAAPDRKFKSIVVQPYVLVQEAAH